VSPPLLFHFRKKNRRERGNVNFSAKPSGEEVLVDPRESERHERVYREGRDDAEEGGVRHHPQRGEVGDGHLRGKCGSVCGEIRLLDEVGEVEDEVDGHHVGEGVAHDAMDSGEPHQVADQHGVGDHGVGKVANPSRGATSEFGSEEGPVHADARRGQGGDAEAEAGRGRAEGIGAGREKSPEQLRHAEGLVHRGVPLEDVKVHVRALADEVLVIDCDVDGVVHERGQVEERGGRDPRGQEKESVEVFAPDVRFDHLLVLCRGEDECRARPGEHSARFLCGVEQRARAAVVGHGEEGEHGAYGVENSRTHQVVEFECGPERLIGLVSVRDVVHGSIKVECHSVARGEHDVFVGQGEDGFHLPVLVEGNDGAKDVAAGEEEKGPVDVFCVEDAVARYVCLVLGNVNLVHEWERHNSVRGKSVAEHCDQRGTCADPRHGPLDRRWNLSLPPVGSRVARWLF